MAETTNNPPADRPLVKDGCPAWADQILRQIHEIEVRLGNVQEPGEWQTMDMEKLINRLAHDDLDQGGDDETVERLFQRVATGLAHEGHTPAQIVQYVNARVGAGGRLPYCNEAEVREAIASA